MRKEGFMKGKIKLSPGERGVLFLLAVFLFCFISWKAYSLFIRLQFQQALDAFDPETTEFEITFSSHRESGQKTQDQLTPEQRQLVARYLQSLDFETAHLVNPLEGVAGGSSFYIIYETPQGRLSAGRFAHLDRKNGKALYAEYEVDNTLYHQLIEIALAP